MILSTPLKNLSHRITQTLTARNKEPAHLHDAILNRDTGIHKPQALLPCSSSGWLSGFSSVETEQSRICGMSPHKAEPSQELPLAALWQHTLSTQYCLQQLPRELPGEVEGQKRDNMDLDMGINRSCWRFAYWTHPLTHTVSRQTHTNSSHWSHFSRAPRKKQML